MLGALLPNLVKFEFNIIACAYKGHAAGISFSTIKETFSSRWYAARAILDPSFSRGHQGDCLGWRRYRTAAGRTREGTAIVSEFK